MGKPSPSSRIRKVLLFLSIMAMLTKSLHTLTPLGQTDNKELSTNKLLELLTRLANTNIGRERRINDANLKKAKAIFNMLTKNMDSEKVTKVLREGPKDKAQEIKRPKQADDGEKRISSEYAKVVETELSTALKDQSSALLNKAYVEQNGKNDFLVMKDVVSDPFVTVIPNAIYYDIEKKCVNWLDDCSLDGIRAKLFQAMRSPY